MKVLIFIFLVLNYFGFTAQNNLPVDSISNLITYTDVVKVSDSISKKDLYIKAKSTFVNLFKNSQNVIQNEDNENCIISGKGTIKAYARAMGTDYDGGYVNFTLTIVCKNGRFKYTITNLIHDGAGSKMPSGGNLENDNAKTWTTKQWDTMKSQIDVEIKDLISSIKIEMNKSLPQDEKW